MERRAEVSANCSWPGMESHVKWFAWLFLVTACDAPMEKAVEEIPNCLRIEGVPVRHGDQSPVVKCLVDRYGWEPAAASAAAATFIEQQYERLDSVAAVEARRADSALAAEVAAEAERARQRRAEAERAAAEARAQAERDRRRYRARTTGTPPERTFFVDYRPEYRGRTAVVKLGEPPSGAVVEQVYDYRMTPLLTYSGSYRVQYADGTEATFISGFHLKVGLNRIYVYISGELLDRPVLIQANQ